MGPLRNHLAVVNRLLLTAALLEGVGLAVFIAHRAGANVFPEQLGPAMICVGCVAGAIGWFSRPREYFLDHLTPLIALFVGLEFATKFLF